MPIPKKYLHDKLILLLISLNISMAFLCVALVLLRVGLGQGIDGYIVEYRSNLGLSAFSKGSIVPLLSFALFAPVTLIINIILSIKVYHVRRSLAIVLLALSLLLLVLAIVVSNALLVLY